MLNAKDRSPYYEFKGECEERIRLIYFLFENNALIKADDFYYAAFIVANSDKWQNFVFSYRLIQKSRELSGKKRWGFSEKFFAKQNWGKTKEQAENDVEKIIGMHPRELN